MLSDRGAFERNVGLVSCTRWAALSLAILGLCILSAPLRGADESTEHCPAFVEKIAQIAAVVDAAPTERCRAFAEKLGELYVLADRSCQAHIRGNTYFEQGSSIADSEYWQAVHLDTQILEGIQDLLPAFGVTPELKDTLEEAERLYAQQLGIYEQSRQQMAQAGIAYRIDNRTLGDLLLQQANSALDTATELEDRAFQLLDGASNLFCDPSEEGASPDEMRTMEELLAEIAEMIEDINSKLAGILRLFTGGEEEDEEFGSILVGDVTKNWGAPQLEALAGQVEAVDEKANTLLGWVEEVTSGEIDVDAEPEEELETEYAIDEWEFGGGSRPSGAEAGDETEDEGKLVPTPECVIWIVYGLPIMIDMITSAELSDERSEDVDARMSQIEQVKQNIMNCFPRLTSLPRSDSCKTFPDIDACTTWWEYYYRIFIANIDDADYRASLADVKIAGTSADDWLSTFFDLDAALEQARLLEPGTEEMTEQYDKIRGILTTLARWMKF
jgi:hypothetical protein